MLNLRRLTTSDTDFTTTLDKLLAWEGVSNPAVQQHVEIILATVRKDGDKAVLAYTQEFDKHPAQSIEELVIQPEQLEAAFNQLEPKRRAALETAAQRVTAYHQHQKQESWQITEADGTTLGQEIRPLDRVGVYVPGGKAAYPSSVLMNVLPAKVAGVKEIIMVAPAPKGELNPLVLAAAHLCGVTQVFALGGAQAIGALAYGTATVPPVDKIVGPGNIYVATAKKSVFGKVGIDMIAGPSEILVVGDGKTNPDWVAMDLFSQAEHDEDAQSILISWDKNWLDLVEASMNKLLADQPRKEIIQTSLESRGALIEVANEAEALELINRIAAEHLELSVANPEDWLPNIRHAGAIFMGRYTAEALGDYCAGPNHVLPTSGTARFSSPLGVYDFQKRSSVVNCTPQMAAELADTAAELAQGEGLVAHAQSALYRKNPAEAEKLS